MRSRLLAVVLGLQLVLFLPSLLSGGVMGPPLPKASEVTGQTAPWHEFWRDEVRAGRPPFWNPYMFGGTPLVAEPQAQTFYPAQVLWLLFSSEWALKMYLLLHAWLAAWLMYRLVRELGGSRAGAAVAALAFGAHGQMITFAYAGWVQMLAPMSWAPGVIWQLVRAFRRTGRASRQAVGLAGLMIGVQILGGHPEWLRYTLAIAAMLTLFAQPLRSSLTHRLAIFITAVAIGFLVGGPQLAPLAQAVRHSDRGAAALAGAGVAERSGLPLPMLIAAVAPRLFGPWDLGITADSLVHKLSGAMVSYGETLVYVGVLPLLAALLVRRRDARALGPWPWIAIGVVGLVFAANDVTRAQSMLDRVIPFDAAFRTPGRWVFLTNFSLAVLSGLGVSTLSGGTTRVRRTTRLALIAGASFAGAAIVLWLGRDWITAQLLSRLALPARAAAAAGGEQSIAQLAVWAFGQSLREMAAAAAMLGLAALALRAVAQRQTTTVHIAMLALLAIDLAWAGWPFLTSRVSIDDAYARDRAVLMARTTPPFDASTTRTTPPYTVYAHTPTGLIGDNHVVPLRVRSLIGYESFRVAESKLLSEALAARPLEDAARASATHVLRPTEGGPVLAPIAGARPRAWFAASVELVPNPTAGIDRLFAQSDNNTVVIEETFGVERQESAGQVSAIVTIERDDPGRIGVKVSSDRPGWIVLHETYYPGWRARVNGTPARDVRAFGVIQAIEVPAGQSLVVVEFRPSIVWTGVLMCALGLAAAAAFSFSGRSAATLVP